MERKSHLAYFWANLRNKHRISVQNEHDGSELWYIHISPLRAVAVLLATVLLLFIVIVTLVAYTPILDLIPGYPGNKSREMLIENSVRLDSMEREMASMQIYADNVALIMEGKTPVVRDILTGSDSTADSRMVFRSEADSLLRTQMQGEGPYHLNDQTPAGTVTRESLALVTPVQGVVATRFLPREGRYGVGLATSADQPVAAVRDGTVAFASWSPTDGHVIGIQHADNTLSIYRHAARIVPETGARVRGGEVIAYTGDGVEGEAGKGYFELELWIGGTPVNPENYIVF